jgi:hypothetical protein
MGRESRGTTGRRSWLQPLVGQLVPGKPWQQALARGIEEARSCAICLGSNTPDGWFRREVEKALNRQTRDEDFGVIPVLLPGAKARARELLGGTFADLNTWVDFSGTHLAPNELHLLVCGIRGVPPGRPPQEVDGSGDPVAARLRKLQALRNDSLVDEAIILEFQRKILDEYLEF